MHGTLAAATALAIAIAFLLSRRGVSTREDAEQASLAAAHRMEKITTDISKDWTGVSDAENSDDELVKKTIQVKKQQPATVARRPRMGEFRAIVRGGMHAGSRV